MTKCSILSTFSMYCAKLDIQDIFHLLKCGLQIEKNSCNKVDDEENNDDDGASIRNAYFKMCTVLKKLKHSEQLRNKLNACYETMNVKFMAPTLDVSMRWNSTFELIKSTIKMKQTVNVLCENNASIQQFSITENDWQILCVVFI